LDGKYDDVPEAAFHMAGDMNEILGRAKDMAEELARRMEEEKKKHAGDEHHD
jgi:hypothetical protein